MPEHSVEGGSLSPVLHDIAAVLAFCREVSERAAQFHAVAPLRLRRQVAGVTFEIATTMPEQVALCEARLGDAAEEGGATVPLVVATAAELGLALPRLGRGIATVQALEEALEPTGFRLHHHAETRFWQLWDRARGIGVQVQADAATLPPWEAGSPLRNLVKWALTTRDCGLLHAGTLGLGGRGFLFAGQGGSGKSGTVLAGLSHGLQSVGDDYVLARDSADGVEALPVFQSLKCDTAGLRRLGLADRAALAAGPTNWQGKHEFTFAQLTGHPPAARLAIRAICLPVIAHAAQTLFEPISPRDAFLALAPTGIAQLPGDRADHFALCARVTRRVPCFRVRLGTDPAEIAGAIRTALEGTDAAC